MSVDTEQSETLRSRCAACAATFSPDALKRASLPSLLALSAVVGLSEPDDPNPISWCALTDRNWYCPACRSRVQRRRGAGLVILGLILPLLAHFLVRWLM
jgi:hypothetical protein